MDQAKNFFANFTEIIGKLSLQQKMLIGGIVLGSVILLFVVIFAFNEPAYGVLYSNLNPEDASKIVEDLNAQKIPYKLENEGRTIKVPQESVYEIRINNAAKGIPSTGIVGYEVFDNQQLGMSDFMQKLNYKRALEGELSKTILVTKGISNARVHIVIPQRAVFKDDQKQPTASVVLQLAQGFEPSATNITAISNLVAGSVEGLTPNNVTIVDSRGKLLSRQSSDNPLEAFSSKQYELKSSVESYLADKAQSMLDGVLGYGNTVVKINVDLDFNQVEKTMNTVDPESQIEISNQSITQAAGGKTYTDSTQSQAQNTTTNYEVSTTLERVISNPGSIKRMTVAAVVNAVAKTVTTDGVTNRVVEERSVEQMEKIQNIISNAVGIDKVRGDEVSVVNIPFEDDFVPKDQLESQPVNFVDEWGNIILMAVAILAALFILRNLLSRLKEEKILIGGVVTDGGRGEMPMLAGIGGGGMMGQGISLEDSISLEQPMIEKKPIVEVGDITKEISDEAIRRQVRQEKITNYVSKNPQEAAKLITLWLREEEIG